MNQFAWSLTFESDIPKPILPFLNIVNLNERWDTVVYCQGETAFDSSKELVDHISSRVMGTMIWFDISISTEDKIAVIDGSKTAKNLQAYWNSNVNPNYKFEVLVGTDFETVLKNNDKNDKILSIREAEVDKENWWRIIKIDTLN